VKIGESAAGGMLPACVLKWTKRLVVGRPLRSERLGETLLPKKLALPVFCSDPLSSNAYATEEILRALSLGGLALFFLAPWVALAVIVLLAVVVVSYRQTCYAYPTGGGAYAVSRANLGRNAALVAASALLVDYVLTAQWFERDPIPEPVGELPYEILEAVRFEILEVQSINRATRTRLHPTILNPPWEATTWPLGGGLHVITPDTP
jgi:hypothetical protein